MTCHCQLFLEKSSEFSSVSLYLAKSSEFSLSVYLDMSIKHVHPFKINESIPGKR